MADIYRVYECSIKEVIINLSKTAYTCSDLRFAECPRKPFHYRHNKLPLPDFSLKTDFRTLRVKKYFFCCNLFHLTCV